jgi:hypothetical protein
MFCVWAFCHTTDINTIIRFVPNTSEHIDLKGFWRWCMLYRAIGLVLAQLSRFILPHSPEDADRSSLRNVVVFCLPHTRRWIESKTSPIALHTGAGPRQHSQQTLWCVTLDPLYLQEVEEQNLCLWYIPTRRNHQASDPASLVANMSVPCPGLLSGQSDVEADFDPGNFEPPCASEAELHLGWKWSLHCLLVVGAAATH